MSQKQKTIDSFFQYKNKNKNIKNIENNLENKLDVKKYFYLIWENKYKPSVQAYWCNDRPENINFMEQISCNYIKKDFYFYICGYFIDDDDKAYTLSKEKVYKNIPYLKSHLQKSIRKQNEELAIQSCYHLFKLDVNELLRRLPIIMLEDVFLHESFTTLIWLMIANSTKKFKMKLYIYEWLLGLVYILCKMNIKDELDKYKDIHEDNIPLTHILDKYKSLEQKEYSVLYCMHLRIAYGVMECDAKMFKAFTLLWEERFKNKSMSMNNIDIKPISIYVKELTIDKWDLSAIDFHCNSKLLELLNKKYNEIEINELKKIIWFHSSSINKRCDPYPYNSLIWNEIKDYVLRTQKYLLESSY